LKTSITGITPELTFDYCVGLNLRPGHAHNGASTITMQLARLRYHLRTRTLSGKFVQIVRALN
jgi:membrane carboxypeptidase/penicillin-binding protein PbpC